MMSQSRKQEVHLCTFQLHLTQGTGNIKFPCTCYAEWKTNNGKEAGRQSNRVKLVQGKLAFDQVLTFSTHLVFDVNAKHYGKKESVIILNLLSKSSPNEPKLVGRVTIQLGSVANGNSFVELKRYPLEFCSVDATLTFKVAMKEANTTNLAIGDFERFQFSESEALSSSKQSIRQDTRSEREGVPSIVVMPSVAGLANKERSIQKPGQSSFQERLTRLKSQNEQFKSSKVSQASYTSRVKRQVESRQQVSVNTNGQSNIYTNGRERQQKRLNTDLSVPILTKNVEQFNSNKILTKKQINQADANHIDSPYKNSENKQPSISNARQQSNNAVNQEMLEESQREASNLKQEVERFNEQNQELKSKVDSLMLENARYKNNMSKLQNQLTAKDDELKALKEGNPSQQIEYLRKIIEEKDNEIVSITAFNQQNQKGFENLETEFEDKINSLKEHIRELQAKLSLFQGKKEPQQTEQKGQNHQDFSSKVVEDLTYKLTLEQANHENAKIQLNELREWYNDLQQQVEKLNEQNEVLKSNLEEERIKVRQLQENASHLTEHQALNQQHSAQIAQLSQEISQKQDQLSSSNELLQHYKSIEEKLTSEIKTVRKQLDELQSKYIELQTNFHQSQDKVKEFAYLLEQSQKQSSENAKLIKQRRQEIQDQQKKMNDLIKRLKEKEENYMRSQRENQQLESKLKQSQSNGEKFKEKVKMLETEKGFDQEKIKTLEKENKQLKAKIQKEGDSFKKEMSKLKQSLENQNNKKKELNLLLSEVQLKSKISQNSKVKDLQGKIAKFIEKERQLKENLVLLEQQSNRIAEILQEKEDNQEKYTQTIIQISQENTFLKSKINEIENQCLLLNQRNQGLQAQIQLLNAYQPSADQQDEVIDLNKRLIDKNKQLLLQIQEKNQLIADLQKAEGQMKGKQVEQILTSSRMQKEKQNYEEKYREVVQENQKLYKQFQKLNHKYQDELNQSNKVSEEKILALQAKIQDFYVKLTEKDLAYAEQEMKSKEELEKIQQSLHEKEYQLEYYPNQIKELTANIEGLNEQIGEKEFQLHLAEQKIKELYEKISNLEHVTEQVPVVSVREPSPSKQKANNELLQELNHYKSRAEFYQAEIDRLHEKEFLLEKDVLTLKEEVGKYKENSQEEVKHISYLQGELKNFRERESQYIQQIEELEEKQGQSLTKSKYTRLEKDKSQLSAQIDRLNSQIQALKQQKKAEKSEQSTPISKFQASPSPQKPSTDMSDIVTELSSILQRRKQQEQLQNALRLVIDNNTRQQQEFQHWSRERGMIQEKAKMVSKELQKIKSQIMKTANRSITEKSQLTNLLKPAETIVNELITLSENLIEMDPYEQQEEEEEQNV